MRRPPPIRWSVFAAVVGALLGVAALVVLQPDPVSRRGQDYAAAIVRGMREAPALPPDDGDENLTRRANEAGYRWAERRDLTDPAACNAWQADFQNGCLAWVREQTR